jgi:nicotinamidase-related amidase
MLNAMHGSLGLLDADKSVLLVIDMQTRLLANMPTTVAQIMLDNSVKLLQAAERLNIPTLLTEQYPKAWDQLQMTLS